MCPGAIRRRGAQRLALQIFGGGDAQGFAAHHGEGRFVIDHHHRRHRSAGVLIQEFHQAVDIGKAHRKGAGGHFRNRTQRAGAFGHFDRQPFGGVIAVVYRQEIGRGRAFKLPVQREGHGGFGQHGRGKKAGDKGKGGGAVMEHITLSAGSFPDLGADSDQKKRNRPQRGIRCGRLIGIVASGANLPAERADCQNQLRGFGALPPIISFSFMMAT